MKLTRHQIDIIDQLIEARINYSFNIAAGADRWEHRQLISDLKEELENAESE